MDTVHKHLEHHSQTAVGRLLLRIQHPTATHPSGETFHSLPPGGPADPVDYRRHADRSQKVLVNNTFHDAWPVGQSTFHCMQAANTKDIVQDPSGPLPRPVSVFEWLPSGRRPAPLPWLQDTEEGSNLCSQDCSAQVVFETRQTPVVPQFTSTVNVNNFALVERTIWQGFEAELAIQINSFLYPFLLKQVCFCLKSTTLLLYGFLISQTTGWVEGHHVNHIRKMYGTKKKP